MFFAVCFLLSVLCAAELNQYMKSDVVAVDWDHSISNLLSVFFTGTPMDSTTGNTIREKQGATEMGVLIVRQKL